MFDLTVFISTSLGLFTALVAMEALNYCMGLYFNNKQAERQKEFEQEFAKAVAEGRIPPGVNPLSMMLSGDTPMSYAMPTVSGEAITAKNESEGYGQYL